MGPQIDDLRREHPLWLPSTVEETLCSLGQVLKSVLFVSLWRDGVWARAADGSYGFLLQEVRKQSFKNGPVPSERSALRFFVINLTHKAGGGDAKAVCNRMWAPFVNILKVWTVDGSPDHDRNNSR